MVAAEDEADFHIYHRVTGDDAVLQRLAGAVIDGGNVLPRHDAAGSLVLKLVAGTAFERLEDELRVGELPAAARLPREARALASRLCDRLTVGDLRAADIGI